MPPRASILPSLAAALLALAAPAGAQDGTWDDQPEGRAQGSYPVQVEVEGSGAATLEAFRSGLAPHGDWVQTGAYGMAWRPRVTAGWRPYYFGRWEWTNEGWLWVSLEPFGWATYHYGRWAQDGGHGWVWVPGYQWAPAWVSWRYGGDVVGWAPLAPGMSLYVTSYAFFDAWWTFVPATRFCGAPVWGVAYPPSRGHQFYGVTAPAPPRPRPPASLPPRGGGPVRPPASTVPTPGWGGPPPRYIEERTGRQVTASRIVAESRPGAAPGRAGEIGVFRPEVGSRGGSAARRAPWERSTPPSSRSLPAPRPGVAPRHDGPPGPAPRQEGRPGQAPRIEDRPGPSPRGYSSPPGHATPRGGTSSRDGGAVPHSSRTSPGDGGRPRPNGSGRHR